MTKKSRYERRSYVVRAECESYELKVQAAKLLSQIPEDTRSWEQVQMGDPTHYRSALGRPYGDVV